MFDEIGVRLQVIYKSLKAKNHHGSPNVNVVTETTVAHGAGTCTTSHTEDSGAEGGFCRADITIFVRS